MAFNDMSAFLPSKSAYTNPGEYETTQRNIALSRGTYMAETDKAYAQLTELAREFDLGHQLEKEKFQFARDIEGSKFLEGVREFDIEANLKQQEINIAGSQAGSLSAYYKSKTRTEDAHRIFDYVGAADLIFKEGGIWDDLGEALF